MSLTNQTKQAKSKSEPESAKNISQPQDRLRNSHTLFSQLCDKYLVEYLDSQALSNIRKAYTLARDAYHGHQRADGAAFIVKAIESARIISELRLDENSICAAILYDIYSKGNLSKEDLQEVLNLSLIHI